jgi:hypothetical protein
MEQESFWLPMSRLFIVLKKRVRSSVGASCYKIEKCQTKNNLSDFRSFRLPD